METRKERAIRTGRRGRGMRIAYQCPMFNVEVVVNAEGSMLKVQCSMFNVQCWSACQFRIFSVAWPVTGRVVAGTNRCSPDSNGASVRHPRPFISLWLQDHQLLQRTVDWGCRHASAFVATLERRNIGGREPGRGGRWTNEAGFHRESVNRQKRMRREASYWLRLIAFAEPSASPAVAPLLDESGQLVRILTTIIKNAQSNPGRGGPL